MADFSALKTAIQTYIKQNGNEEIRGDILQEILLSVVTTLGDSAINDLISALANEVAARQNADGTLQQNITNEATARGNADTALGGRIDDEATARANGDMALSNRLGSTITAENTAADQIGAEAEARAAADTALQELIDGITDNIENGYVYAGIATPSSTPATGKVFYLALTAGTYTNFGSTEVSQGINILKYNGSAWSLDAFIGIDDELTPGSNNIPKSGNVLENIIKNGSAFDLSAYNAVNGVLATYADLDAALAALNLLPAVYKQGGMSFRFVQSSDNKYVQFRLIAQNFTTDTIKWEEQGEKVSLPQNTLMIGSQSTKIHPDSFAPITGTTTEGCTLQADGTIQSGEFFAAFSVVSFSISSGKEYILDFTNYAVNENYAEAAIYKNGNLVKVLILGDGTTTHFAFKLNTFGYDVDTLKISIDSYYESKVICLESRYFKKSEVNADDIANGAITTPKIADNSVTDEKLSTDTRTMLNTQEVNASTSIKSIKGVGGALTYTVYTAKTIDVTTTVGQKIIITDSPYRNLGRIDVGGLNTFVLINDVLPYYSATLQVLAIVDADGIVLATGKSSDQINSSPTAINTASYPTAKYLYFTYNTSATPTAVALDKTGIGDACNLSVKNFQELGGGKENTFLGINALAIDDISVGDLVTLNTINPYRATGCINVAGRKDIIKISKTQTTGGNSYIQCVVADSDNKAIDIVKFNTSGTNVSVDLPLYRYPNAEWVYFIYGTGSSNTPTITSKGINYTEIPLNVYVAYANDTFGENSIGSTFVHISSAYRSTFAVDVKGIKGDFFIKDALNGGQNIYAIVVDKNDIVLDIITYSQTSSNDYTTDVYVNLSQYNDAARIYISGSPNTQYLRQPSGAVVTYSSIEKRIDVIEPAKATLLLHFDGLEGEHDYMTARKALVESYGLKGSFIISKSCFVDQDFTKAWLNNDLEEQFWQLIKDGWDVGLYPSTVSSTYDEEGWKTWMATAIGGLAQKGIFNITTWCAGNLEINADVVNACKANGLRILRGGNGSYAYTLKNTFMPQTLTESKCIVNKAYFVNYQSKLPAFKDWLDCVCASKTCASFFTHQVLDSTTDTNNITTSLFSDMLAYIKTKVDNGELDVLNFREWYAKVNPTDGNNYDYDRLLKMQLFNNQ